MRNKHIEHNGSGFVDPTVDAVIKREYNRKERAKEDYQYAKMTENIKGLIETNGYVLEGPISLINTETGRKRRIY